MRVNTALSCTASFETTPARTAESHGVTERCCPCYISKSKHLSRPRTDVCSLPEIKQGLWGLAVVHRLQRVRELLLTGVSLHKRAREQLIVARDSVQDFNYRRHPRATSGAELYHTPCSIISAVPLLGSSLLRMPWPAEALSSARDRPCDAYASVP